MASLCDRCAVPGRCCSGFNLNGGAYGAHHSELDVLLLMATSWTKVWELGIDQYGLPFMPLWRKPSGVWLFWCPLLTRDGRCGDYDHRPAVCRDFEAGSDSLCVMSCPAAGPLADRS